jgi:tRNA (cmo5U34)-methyltransferase
MPAQHPKPIVKSTVDEIRRRFDADVDRFSNLETGQSATIDAPLALELIAQAAAACSPGAARLLDIGCGAGNYSLKLLERLPDLEITLVDLSRPMLERAQERLAAKTSAKINAFEQDIRQVELPREHYDLVVAAAVLHHLRTEDEWRAVFGKLYDWLRPGGSVWISDLVEHSTAQVQALMWQRYGDYLLALRSREYRDQVLAYVEHEDTPRSLTFQIELLEAVGFRTVEILHKNSVFAAFGAIK